MIPLLPDKTPPLITEVKEEIFATSALISWKTNEPSLSWLKYGRTPAYDKEIKTENYTTSHSLMI
ncbi:MAG: hypothetical protein ACPLY7_02390 [Microgenomates group bacterium]